MAAATKTEPKAAAPKAATKNIFQRMAAITEELQTVAKNLTVSTGGKNSYKAVSERDILDAVKPLEAKHGVYSYPVKREILESHMLESENEYNGKVTKKTTFMTRIATVYRFVNVDKPEEYIETTTFAEGIDAQDKGSGKAMTYGDKYALMKAYKISTGDDPDQEASKDTHYTQETPLVDATKIKVLKDRMAKKGVTDKQILERYKVGSFEELTVVDFMKACSALEKMPDVENKQVDLGL